MSFFSQLLFPNNKLKLLSSFPPIPLRPILLSFNPPLPIPALPVPVAHFLTKPLSSSPLLRFPRLVSRLGFRSTDSHGRSTSCASLLAIAPTSALVLVTLFSSLTHPTLHLDSFPHTIPESPPELDQIDSTQLDQIESILSVQKLSFGTLTGICAGVFVRKGLGLVAFVCGGAFVFLQFLHSRALLTINWSRWAARYEHALHPNPDAPSLPRRLVDFLTADFQYRATFLAGLLLGLRIG